MRALLINDTRSAKHVGCDLVVANTFKEAKRADINIVGTVQNSELGGIRQRIARAPAYDLLLVNGEGTMHDDRKRPLLIGEAAQHAKEAGKKVVLFNTVWQNNVRLNDYLPFFDLLFCRETFSTNSILKAGYRATTIPDMIFASEIAPSEESSGGGTVVVDSVKRNVTTRLALLAAFKRYTFLTMGAHAFEAMNARWWLRSLLEWRTGQRLASPENDFLKQLQKSDTVISGRFHGTCLAFLLSKPVASVPSNTHKIEGLYHDIGLDSTFLKFSSLNAQTIQTQWNHVRAQKKLIEAYIESARAMITGMFTQIRAL